MCILCSLHKHIRANIIGWYLNKLYYYHENCALDKQLLNYINFFLKSIFSKNQSSTTFFYKTTKQDKQLKLISWEFEII